MGEKCLTKDYERFLRSKMIVDRKSGFVIDLKNLNKMLFDWQKVIVKWALARGRAAIFADCGLGKTPMQLEWAKWVCDRENGSILILAPLAVSQQTKREGEKFGIEVNICESNDDIVKGINITNYEKLHKFDSKDFIGIVLDESSILKSFAGVRRNEIINAFGKTKYRLACTATPAPNDYMELGNHCEFLGVMTRVEMLATFFINDTAHTGHWRLKGHIKDNVYWKWMASWAVMLSKPSDIGYDDGGFILPEITYYEHIIKTTVKSKRGLFVKEASTLDERRGVRKETIALRCQAAADLINSTDERWVVWCNLNDEGDYLEKAIEDIVQVAGRHSDDLKTSRMIGFANGGIRRIVTKPKIAGLGMNWQICHNAAFVGLSDSWEQFYQAVRRIWRFMQKHDVNVHIFLEEREGKVLRNIKRKDEQARRMIDSMIVYMKDLVKAQLGQGGREFEKYLPTKEMRLPEWMKS